MADAIPFRTLMKAGRLFQAISLVARDKECVLLIAQELHRAARLRTELEAAKGDAVGVDGCTWSEPPGLNAKHKAAYSALTADKSEAEAKEEQIREDERDRLAALAAVEEEPPFYCMYEWLVERQGAMLPEDRKAKRAEAKHASSL